MERATVKETGLPAKQIVRVTGLGSEPSLSAKILTVKLKNKGYLIYYIQTVKNDIISWG